MSFAAAAAATRLLQEEPGAIPAAEGGPGWSFTAYDDALILCVSALVIKVVLVTLLTVRTRIVSATFRKTPEETSNDEDNGKAVTFIIFYIFKPLLLAGMPGKPDDDVVSEETQTALPAEASTPAPSQLLGRCLAVHRNATEQEPFVLAIAIALKVCCTDPSELCAILLNVVTISRVLYSVAYLCSLQPWRTIFFATAQFPTVALAVLLPIEAAK